MEKSTNDNLISCNQIAQKRLTLETAYKVSRRLSDLSKSINEMSNYVHGKTAILSVLKNAYKEDYPDLKTTLGQFQSLLFNALNHPETLDIQFQGFDNKGKVNATLDFFSNEFSLSFGYSFETYPDEIDMEPDNDYVELIKVNNQDLSDWLEKNRDNDNYNNDSIEQIEEFVLNFAIVCRNGNVYGDISNDISECVSPKLLNSIIDEFSL